MAVEQVNTLFKTALGEYQLQRFPINKKETLRAWDAADEYILTHLVDEKLLKDGATILIINDNFGALSLALNDYKPVVMLDSYLSTQSITMNANNNGVDESLIDISNSMALPEDLLASKADVVLIKLPKSLAMLEDQLHRIRPVLDDNTKVIAAGMTKNIHMSSMELFEKIIGPTKTSLARKKSRLIFSDYNEALTVETNPYPTSYNLPYKLDDVDIEVHNHAAVFSQEKLDIGARFFIENLPVDEKYKTIVDLGCGNGVLGVMSAIKNPAAKTIFTDESFMAVESAIKNFVSIFEESREAEFLQTDCLQGVEDGSVSLILCNPPFHQNNVVTDTIAWQMFSESLEALESKGELWVIGNRHLAYHAKLKHLFNNCTVMASNNKFTLMKAVKE